MIDLATVTADDFESLDDRSFQRVAGDGEPALTLTLTEIRRGRPRADGRDPFALTFVGPAHLTLAAGSHPLRHAILGDVELFVTPVAGDVETVTYESVFG